MTRVTDIENKREYAKLLVDMLPHVIHTEEENERNTAALERLLAKRDRTTEEGRMVELLMRPTVLRQVDLIDVFGAESTVSEFLNGKRDLAKSHIEKLSLRFNVSPELFFEQHPRSAISDVKPK